MSPIQEAQVSLPHDEITEAATSNYMLSVMGGSNLDVNEASKAGNSVSTNPSSNITNLPTNGNVIGNILSNSQNSTNLPSLQTSLSPKTSITSASPPVSPMFSFGLPPSYQAHMNALEQRHVPSSQPALPVNPIPSLPEENLVPTSTSRNTVNTTDKCTVPSSLTSSQPSSSSSPLTAVSTGQSQNHPVPKALPSDNEYFPSNSAVSAVVNPPLRQAGPLHEQIPNPPLSPISESSSGVGNNLSGGNTRSVSAAVSDESVAGDSGVFEASVKRSVHFTFFFGKLKWVLEFFWYDFQFLLRTLKPFLYYDHTKQSYCFFYRSDVNIELNFRDPGP